MTNDHGHNWEHTCIMQAHLHMSFHARLSTAGSFKRHSANSLRTEHQCDCSARKLALGRTYTGRSFLEEEQHHRVSTEFKRLTHCAYLQNKPDLGDNLRNQAFWTVRLPRTQQQRNWHAFAPQNMTLNVLILRWMNLLIFAFVSLLFVVGLMFSSEGKASYFGGYTMEMALKEKLQSANLSTPFLTFGFVSIRMMTNDDGFFPTRFEDQSMPFVLSR